MATKFPLQLNNLRFFVNPTNLNITKGVNFGTLPTQSGVKYQVWYDAPEVLTIAGVSAGKTAYKELVFLKRNFERTNKQSELFYKTRIYKGFITNITVEHGTSHINEFTYTIIFQLLFGEKFAIEDFSVTGNERGIVARTLQQLDEIINEPIRRLESSIEKLLNKI
jgi:hypothetical protein